MSLQMKLIIPLLDEKITIDDLTPEAGFFDAYNYDINRPYLDDCIFLMYDDSVRTKESAKRYRKFEELSTVKNKKFIYIDGHCYILYAFVIINKDVKNILKGLRHSKNSSYTRFLQFWGATDGVVNRYLLYPSDSFNHEVHSVPEEDYHHTIDEIREGGLRIKTELAFSYSF